LRNSPCAGESSIPFWYGKIIEAIAIKHNEGLFKTYMTLCVLTAAVTGLATGVRGSSFLVLGARFSMRIRRMLFDRSHRCARRFRAPTSLQMHCSLLKQDMAFFDVTKSGEVSSRSHHSCCSTQHPNFFPLTQQPQESLRTARKSGIRLS
jgi:hypothetical protein